MNPDRDNRRTRACALLAQLDADAPEKIAASLDSLSGDVAEIVLC